MNKNQGAIPAAIAFWESEAGKMRLEEFKKGDSEKSVLEPQFVDEMYRREKKHWNRIIEKMRLDIPILEAKKIQFHESGACVKLITHQIKIAKEALETAELGLSKLEMR